MQLRRCGLRLPVAAPMPVCQLSNSQAGFVSPLHPRPCPPPQVVQAQIGGMLGAMLIAYVLESLHSKHKQPTFVGAQPGS